MKKKLLLISSMLLFVSMMAFNMYVGNTQKASDVSGIALADLVMMPMMGQAEEGGEVDCSSGQNCDYHMVTGTDPFGKIVCCHSSSTHSTGNKESLIT